MNTKIESFNIRVYALIIENGHILISKELIRNKISLKFPGGGVEKGEGIIEALQRESREELKQMLINVEHFYTTDFFQQSAYNKKDQLISIYYKAKLSFPEKLIHENHPIDDRPVFYWKKIDELTKDELSFPIDKHVLDILKSNK
ncbi:MAG: NUDIX hydrolase [Crocinitomicaceae bacterium]|nr:NUDIX hydrolase [Crocinitomicaceae bacterium]|tara:strand:- start:929 stop:1363 length:435 start_codon:yes stop_codon:yes gene_type:complete